MRLFDGWSGTILSQKRLLCFVLVDVIGGDDAIFWQTQEFLCKRVEPVNRRCYSMLHW